MPTTITILGSGTPNPAPDRFGTAFVLKIDDHDLIMVDCGPGATLKLAQAGYSPVDVGALFITHHHYDHNVDVPCLLLCRWDQLIESGKPICIRGPRPTIDFVEKLVGVQGAFQPDVHSRIHWSLTKDLFVNAGGVLPRLPPAYDVSNIEDGFTEQLASCKVTAASAVHAQPCLDSLAYRFDTPYGAVVFTGDTEYTASVVGLAKGARILFCMALAEGQGICDARTAGRIAVEAGVETLVLTHTRSQAALPGNREVLVAEASDLFKWQIHFGDELQSFVLE